MRCRIVGQLCKLRRRFHRRFPNLAALYEEAGWKPASRMLSCPTLGGSGTCPTELRQELLLQSLEVARRHQVKADLER